MAFSPPPALGVGVSTEFGAADRAGALDPVRLRREFPAFGGFLEVGVETAAGLDATARGWARRGWPTTYHFLDVNLDEPEDFDERWLDEVRALVEVLKPAWMCGDAGLWHIGARDRGQMLLLPPVLEDDAARALADGVVRLSEAMRLPVFPENPPGLAFVGPLHLLDFFARVADHADTGLLLDIAHLVIFQHARGLPPLTGLDGFPAERVVEIHVAGARPAHRDGLHWLEDDHSPELRPETWAVLEALLPRATNLRAVVFECERNPLASVLPTYRRLYATVRRLAPWALPS